MSSHVELVGVTKRFGNEAAVDNVSFTVAPGSNVSATARAFTPSGQSRRPVWEIVTPNDLRNSDVVSMEKLASCYPTETKSQKPEIRNR